METAKYNYCIRKTSVLNTNSHKKRADALAAVSKRWRDVEVDFPDLKEYNAYAFVLWMIRLYTYTVKENDFDDEFLKREFSQFQKLYEEYSEFIIGRLKPMKRIILFIMLWDMDKGKEILKKIDAVS